MRRAERTILENYTSDPWFNFVCLTINYRKKMTNIVYLFGAGASYGALPIVKEIPERLKDFIKKLKSEEFDLSSSGLRPDGRSTYQQGKSLLIEDLEWLYEKTYSHASVDTFAKKLFLTGDDRSLIKLKLALSIFFIHEQLKNPPNDRYDVFFSSVLLTDVRSFPKNIKIISWNYDYQFELAYSEFSGTNNLKANQSALNVIAKYNIAENARDDGFTIYKLNGATNMRTLDNKSEILFLNDLKRKFDKMYLCEILDKYLPAFARNDESACTLSFAWEGFHDHPDSFSSIVTAKLKNTEVLVCIGYSFPFFNRAIDRKIIGSMDKLKKVYLQSPEAEVIQERFEAIIPENRKINFILKKDTGQFFLPNEL